MAKLMFNEDGKPMAARKGAQQAAGKGHGNTRQLMQSSNKGIFSQQLRNSKAGGLRHTGREAGAYKEQRQQIQSSKRKREDNEDQDHLKRALKRMEMGPDDDMSDMSDLSDDMEDELDEDAPAQHRGGMPGSGTGYAIGEESDEEEEGSDGEDDDVDEDEQADDSDEELGADGDDSDADANDFDRNDDDDDDDDDQQPEEAHTQTHTNSGKQRQQHTRTSDANQQQGDDSDDGSQSDRHHSENEHGDSESEDEEQQAAMAQLAELPLEQRLQLLQDGTGPRGKVAKVAAKEARIQEQDFKRANRHRPQEMSSKRPVSRFREIVAPARKAAKDPRFGTHISDIEKEKAAKRYAFLFDDVLAKEKSDLRTALKSAKQPGARNALSAQLQRVEQALAKEKQRRVRSDLEQKFKSQQRSAVEAGKKPFFLKAADKKKLELVAKYQELKSKGQLDRYVEKRRKRNASKDHRYVPAGRRGDAEDM